MNPLRFSLLSFFSCLGISLFLISPLFAQVFELGPSPSSNFDAVFNLPGNGAVIVGNSQSVGGFGLIQLNVSTGAVGNFFSANSGGEVNISGGSLGTNFSANSGSEVNISGGTVGDDFAANFGSVVNISGGTVGEDFVASSGSLVNISGGAWGGALMPYPIARSTSAVESSVFSLLPLAAVS